MRRLAAGLLAGSIALAALIGACAQAPRGADADDSPVLTAELAHGARVYAEHCTVCHGVSGDGNGEASHLLFPPARDFGSGLFRLVSTTNGVPTDDDLQRTLRRGMPGSAMPSWGWLPDEDRIVLTSWVRHLAVEGLTERKLEQARESGETLGREEARELARRWMTPGPLVAAARTGADGPELAARGAELYGQFCAACHGEDGKGFGGRPRWNPDGTLNWARDFTAGFLKGGASPDDLTRRIRAGLPGSPMPATDFTDAQDLAALVAHVRGLIPEGAEMRRVQQRRSLRVPRVEGPLPLDALDERWRSVGEIEVILAPLSWNAEAVSLAWISAVHDGNEVAIRLSWIDPTGDATALGMAEFPDAAALQLALGDTPPLFGMGAPDAATTVWFWSAFRDEELAGALDLLENPAHEFVDPATGRRTLIDVTSRRPLPGVSEPSRGADELQGTGVGDVEPVGDDMGDLRALPVRTDEGWSVVFVRPLQAEPSAGIAVTPGRRVQVSCAVWNGAAGDRGGQKSISVWQELSLDR